MCVLGTEPGRVGTHKCWLNFTEQKKIRCIRRRETKVFLQTKRGYLFEILPQSKVILSILRQDTFIPLETLDNTSRHLWLSQWNGIYWPLRSRDQRFCLAFILITFWCCDKKKMTKSNWERKGLLAYISILQSITVKQWEMRE